MSMYDKWSVKHWATMEQTEQPSEATWLDFTVAGFLFELALDGYRINTLEAGWRPVIWAFKEDAWRFEFKESDTLRR